MSQKMFRLFSYLTKQTIIKSKPITTTTMCLRNNNTAICQQWLRSLNGLNVSFIRSYSPPSWGPPKPNVDKNEIAARVLKTIALHDKCDKTILTTSSHFNEDLSLDSLDVIEIIMQIEDEFKIEISDLEAIKMLKVSDIIDYTIKTLEEYVDEYQRPPIEYQAGDVEK